MSILLIPFIVQFLAIFFDEFYFHRKRGLPFWERIGHPLDTLSVFACLAFTCLTSFTTFNLKIYIGLCIISMIMITKDEFIHKDICPKLEMWLHALLFINHPLLLISAGLMWSAGSDIFPLEFMKELACDKHLIAIFLKAQAVLTLLFCVHQLIFWNFIFKHNHDKTHEKI